MENPDNIKEVVEMEAIERYLQGDMKGKELKDFEDRLVNNPSFAQEVDLFLDLIQSIEINGDEKLKASISKVHKSLEKDNFFEQASSLQSIQEHKEILIPQVTLRRAKIRRFLSIAAGVIFLITGTFFLFKPPSIITPKEQFTKVFKPETKQLNTILDNLESYGLADSNIPRKKALVKALYLYEKGDYQQAQKDLSKHIITYKEDNISSFYLGLCYLHTDSYTEATTHLQSLAQDENFELYDESRWYLALSYMMLNSTKGEIEAKKILRRILLDPNTKYKENAQNTLDYLTKK